MNEYIDNDGNITVRRAAEPCTECHVAEAQEDDTVCAACAEYLDNTPSEAGNDKMHA